MARHARTFETIRPEVLERLIDVRGSIDQNLSGVPSEVIREEFDAVLDRMQGYLGDGDVERYRAFASRWVAFRLGEGFSPENLIHSVVALGDVVVEVAREKLPSGPEGGGGEFVREVVRMNYVAARLIVEILAGELEAMRKTMNPGRLR
jgi:hypothetical protein